MAIRMPVVVACAWSCPLAAQAPARPPTRGPRPRGLQDRATSDAAQRFYGELLGYPVVQPRDGRRAAARAREHAAGDRSRAWARSPMWTTGCRTSRLRRPTCRRSRRTSTRAASPPSGPESRTAAASGCARRDPDGNVVEFVQEDVIVAAPPTSPYVPLSTRLYHTGVAVRDEAEGARVLSRGAGPRRDLARRRRSGAHQLGQHARARRHRLRRVHAQRQAAHARSSSARSTTRACSCPTSRPRGKPSARARRPPPAPPCRSRASGATTSGS